VLVVPVRVQGEGAAAEIASAIEVVNRLADPIDVLVVGRGGGSLEDLWSFNEEIVVRAIHASRIPVVSAVGHEIDVTLADLVADVRALTPSEAAERVVPSAEEIKALLRREEQRLTAALVRRAADARLRLEAAAASRALRRPKERIELLSQRLDDLDARALRAVSRRAEIARGGLATQAGRLESLSPLAVLARGYSIASRLDDGGLLRSTGQLQVGERVRTQLAAGAFTSRVEAIEPVTARGDGNKSVDKAAKPARSNATRPSQPGV
jgi:exodeoxyribonuclease VII large subunit